MPFRNTGSVAHVAESGARAGPEAGALKRNLGITCAEPIRDPEGTTEELQASNKERRASNKEILSMNEELQAASDEREISKEELQALSRELIILNRELEAKAEAQRRTARRLSGLLISSDVIALLLDPGLRIAFFTPNAERLFAVGESDVGRPLDGVARTVADPDLLDDARAVLAGGAPVRREVGAEDGAWYSRTVLPYRGDHDDGFTGVVVTFANIPERKRAERRLAAEHAVGHVLAHAADFDEAGPSVLDAFCTALGVEVAELWVPGDDGQHLACAACHAARALGGGAEAFKEVTARTTFAPGVGLVGRVWRSREPAWVTDVTRDPNILRHATAAELDLRTGFAFPILVGESCAGVMSFFTRRALPPEPPLLAMMAAIGRDIGQFTRRTRAEAALRESEERLRLALDAGRMGTWDWDLRTDQLLWDARQCELFGIDPADGSNLDTGAFFGRVHPDDLPRVQRGAEAALKGLSTFYVEFRIIRADGGERWLAGKGDAIADATGRPVRMIGVNYDITERKAAERALRDSEAKFRGTFENAAVGIAHVSLEGEWQRVNQRLCEIVGYHREELLGTTFQDITHPDDLAPDLEQADRLLRGEIESYQMEKRYIHKQGHLVWANLTGAVQRDADGKPLYFIAVVQDITKRKQAEAAQADSAARLRLIADAMPVLISYVDSEQRYRFVNRGYEDWFGHTRAEIEGRTLREVLGAEAFEAIREQVEAALAGEPVAYEAVVPYRAAGTRYVEARYMPHRGPTGEVLGFYALIRDISERKRAEQAMAHAATLRRAILDAVPAHIAVLDRAGNIMAANAAWDRFAAENADRGPPTPPGGINYLGVSEAARDRRSEDAADAARGIHAVLAGKCTRFTLEYRYPCHESGEERWFELTAVPLSGAGAAGAVVMHVDVTEQRRLTEERFQAFLDAAPDALVVVRPDCTIRSVNRQAERLFGYARAELLGRPVETLMSERYRERHLEHQRRYFANPRARPMGVELEIHGLTRDGREVPLEVSLSPITLADGTMAVAAARDITERKRAEAALRESERRFRTFMEESELVCVTLDPDGTILFCNAYLLALTGRRREEVEGGNWFDLFIPDEDRARIRRVHADCLTGNRVAVPPNFENEILTRGGERRLIAWNNVPVCDARGGTLGVTSVGSDVTEQRRGEAALREARDAADRANAMKSRFVAAASHDLRQPLQTIGLLQGVLARTAGDEVSRGAVVRLGETVTAMADVIDALLDIDRLESGSVQPELAAFPVRRLLDRMRSRFGDLAGERGLGLRVVPCSAMIRSDSRLLERLVENLVSNALKYTEAGGRVLLGCRRRGRDVRIEVWDTGIGIPADQLGAIFREYYRAAPPCGGPHRHSGLGLGLSLVQRLAELMGHRIEVRSNPGRGSMFAVELPMEPADRGEATAPPVRPEVSALLIEDDAAVRDGLHLLLELDGYTVNAAGTADEALALAAGCSAPPRLVITDYSLPGGATGVRLIRRLREATGWASPAIVLTGDTSPETRREIEGAGCRYLAKPVTPDDLLVVAARLAGHERRGGATGAPRPTLPPTPRLTTPAPRPEPEGSAASATAPTVFVVEDDHEVRDAVRALLEAAGHRVEVFASAEAFLGALCPGDAWRRACAVVDVGLPGMSGLRLQERLNADAVAIPVVVVTGRQEVPLAVQAMRAGAVDFLEKPFANERLLEAVDRALARAAPSPAPADAPGPDAADIAARFERLTPRERAVIALVAVGHANKEVAHRLGLSPRTIENYRARAMTKLGVRSLAELVRHAVAAEGAGCPIFPE